MSLKRTRNSLETSGDRKKDNPFVFYGTALPSYDSEARDDGSYVPLWKQEVTDERGRKRLHGAFTGGFSAGYFNTVGSKEGWTPATFKSSRAARAQATLARPEDFMDAEDLAEAAEAQKLETNISFTGLGSTGDELVRRGKQITLIDLLTPAVQDTMGVKLLKRMGWKEGQGIGPKVRRKAQISDEDDGGDTTDGDCYLLAPKNSTLVKFNKKSDMKGMGYIGEGYLREQPGEQTEESILSQLSGSKLKKYATRGGFGVGVLNDDGEEDDDPYEIRPKTAYNRIIVGEKSKKSAKPPIKKPTKHVFISKKSIKARGSINLRKCHDGRAPLDGFVLSSSPAQLQDGWYLPPEVPSHWVPSGPDAFQKKDHQSQLTVQTILTRKGPETELKLDPRTRGSLLGETPLPGKSVFDFMTPAARDRIASVTGNKNLPQALSEAPPSSSGPSSLADLVPKLDPAVALGAIRGGFMPYADDPDKRTRYRTFLEVQAGLKGGLPDRKYGMNTQDWIKELNEFMGAARIFKPLTGMIANRFTSATTNTTNFHVNTAVSTSTDVDIPIYRPQPSPEEPVETAAKMSMYGPITRSIVEFFPTRLLCKRFNVKPPMHAQQTGGNGENGAGSWEPTHSPPRELVSKAQMTEMMREARGDQNYTLPEAKNAMPTVDTETNEALEAERAGDDVFKAIFGDDNTDADE
ncbi:hypothetical protein DFP73DRAFT_559760 [Morchella snyderi]|nr:hypothetical protein DFP73DRAFT_559760 [Morchella snyderi]